MLKKLQRETSSGRFIPEIDGLRFLAILWVVLFHLEGYVLARTPDPFREDPGTSLLHRILSAGDQGVPLFFVISGFILALPFAEYHIRHGKPVRLKAFYLRRLTRLEPPYVLAMVGLFCAAILLGKYTFSELLPSLLASLFYVHELVFGRMPLVTAVAWSLEIEVQFYLLAPFLAYGFAIRPAPVRRVVMLLVILAFAALSAHFPLPVRTLYAFAHFFLLGFLLADVYLSDIRLPLPNGAALLLGLAVLAGLLLTKLDGSLGTTLFYLGLIFIFYYLVLTTAPWRRGFSRRPVVVVGGMCYSLYLLHLSVISQVGRLTVGLRLTDDYLPNLLLQMLLMVPVVLGVGGLYFYLVEKPCMSRNWHVRLYRRLTGRGQPPDRSGLEEMPGGLRVAPVNNTDGQPSGRTDSAATSAVAGSRPSPH